MLVIPPAKTHKKRYAPKKTAAPSPPPPVTLNLVEVIYPVDAGDAVRLRFDQDISIGLMSTSQIVVSDHVAHQLRQGFGGGALIDSRTVQVELANVGVYAGTEDLLNASADSGIVAVEDGTAWAGVSDLGLPFP